MQRIEATEGSTFWIGEVPVSVAYARGGQLVAFVASEPMETADQAQRRAAAERVRLTERAADRHNRRRRT